MCELPAGILSSLVLYNKAGKPPRLSCPAIGCERHKYGQQRVWGTVGVGVTCIITGFLVDYYSRGLPQQDYLPMIISAFVFLTLDLLVVARMDIPYSKNTRLQIKDVGGVLRRPRVVLVLVRQPFNLCVHEMSRDESN